MPATRKVVMLRADAVTQAALAAWAEEQGFDLAAGYGGEPRPAAGFAFHVTLFATVEPCDLPEIEGPVPPLVLSAIGFAALGEDEATPLLELAPDAMLAELRDGWLDTSGCTPTYAEFRPHVTLSYAWDGTPSLDVLTLPDFPLIVDHLEISSLSAPSDSPSGSRPEGAGAATKSAQSVRSVLERYETLSAEINAMIDAADFTDGDDAALVAALAKLTGLKPAAAVVMAAVRAEMDAAEDIADDDLTEEHDAAIGDLSFAADSDLVERIDSAFDELALPGMKQPKGAYDPPDAHDFVALDEFRRRAAQRRDAASGDQEVRPYTRSTGRVAGYRRRRRKV